MLFLKKERFMENSHQPQKKQAPTKSKASSYTWDLDHLRTLARAINVADAEAIGRNEHHSCYDDQGTIRRSDRSQTCSA